MILNKKNIMSACCIAAAVLMTAQSAYIESEAVFGSSITDTEDIEIYIDVNKDRKNISKYIYGLNDIYNMSDVTVNSTKQSGAELSSYNWETNYANLAADGAYENSISLVSGYSRSELSTPALYTDKLVKDAAEYGIHSKYVTLQMMGRVANDSYGAVSLDDSPQRFASVLFNKNSDLFIQPDIHDDTVYMDEYVSFLVNTYGYAAEGGINGYFLDSEPEKWDDNYAVLNLEPITAEKLVSDSERLASTVKKIDSTALVYGPSIGGLEAYVNLENPLDWEQYSSEYSWFIDYYLDKMREASELSGMRLLDVLDLHFISEAKSAVLEPIIGSDSVFANEGRIQAVRALWDSNYTDNSNSAILYKQHTPIIPMVQASIRMYYPDTKLSFSEYNFGGGNHISGGIAEADVLGVFSEQEVYMACLKPDLAEYNYQKSGINIYTNYDGEGSSYGNVAVYADNQGDTMSSVYASVTDGDNSSLKAIFINKNEGTEKDADVTVNSDAVYHRADVYSFNSESSEIVLSDTIENIEDNSFSYTMDPLTVYLFVFDGDSVIAEDDQTEGSDTTTVTTSDVPEHVEVSGETRPNPDESSQPDTTDMAETTTSVSVVGTDADGETITEVITESAETAVSDGDTAEEEDEEAEKKTVPKAAKVIIGVLVVAVFVIMLFILISDNKTDKIDKH